jgi:FtsP/CotA-like multicopper oxidase with cupredoxin domain
MAHHELPARSLVALLTAGYAALAALVVTFVIGYPITWSIALITLAVLGAGTVLTAHAISTNADDAGDSSNASTDGADDINPGFSRRRLLTVVGGAAVVTAGGAGAWLTLLPNPTVSTGGGRGPTSRATTSVADLRGATAPAPGGTRHRHVLTAQTATTQLASGKQLDAWTYNGQAPGPAIVATEGDLLEVTLRNTDIDDGVTVHWHGYDVACGEDGAPGATQLAVRPDDEFVYRFRADQVGTYWYHTHQVSHEGVRRGLYGTLVVHPRDAQQRSNGSAETLDLTLPVHTFDGTVVIGDHDGRTEHTAPAGTPVRLRLINTDSDPHQLSLVGTTFQVAAVDGRDLHQPGQVSDIGLRLPAGGRYDLVFDMPDTPVALLVDNDRDGGVRLRPVDETDTAEPAVGGTPSWPELDLLHYGQPTAVPFDFQTADRHFTIVLGRGVAMVDGRPTYAHIVNGRGHPSIPDQLVAEGDIVRFTVVNRSLETHPWHLHGHPVLLLSRDGTPSSGSPLWVDTFDVRPGEVWEVAFEATNPGIWMNHCHNLPHSHQGMMLRLVYDGITPFDDARGHHGH